MRRSPQIIAFFIAMLQAQLSVLTPLGAEQLESCVYVARATQENPTPELQPYPDCARLVAPGRPQLHASHLDRIAFGEDGLAPVLVGGDWYYVTPAGNALGVITYDNGADDFSEGLVRGLRNGKIAYFDTSFVEIVPPEFDWGWPFQNGRALVCTGCGVGERAGEHRAIVGGKWGFIDATGKVVVPVELSRREALGYEQAPRNQIDPPPRQPVGKKPPVSWRAGGVAQAVGHVGSRH